MKKYSAFVFFVCVFIFCRGVLADEVQDKTDGSFVGDNPQQPINSSFIGNDASSVDNDEFQGQNSYFAGDNSDKEEQGETVNAFVGDNTFVGSSYGK